MFSLRSVLNLPRRRSELDGADAGRMLLFIVSRILVLRKRRKRLRSAAVP